MVIFINKKKSYFFKLNEIYYDKSTYLLFLQSNVISYYHGKKYGQWGENDGWCEGEKMVGAGGCLSWGDNSIGGGAV